MERGSGRLRVVCLTGPPGGIAPDAAAAIARLVPEVNLSTHAAADPLERAGPIDCLIATGVAPALSSLGPEVRWVHIWGTGVERVPPVAYEGRLVSCTRGASAAPIAEFVLAAMLAFEKHLPDVWLDRPPAQWYRAELGMLRGRSLALVGLGAIGQAVARLALAFGMSVTALRRRPAPSPVAGVALAATMTQLVADARHLVVAAPATSATRQIISASVLAAMPAGGHLVNVARGSLVDHNALRVSLDAGHLGLATLDTADPEPVPAGHWLYEHSQVRLSPHVSWSGEDASSRFVELTADNLRAAIAGRALPGLVDPGAGY